MTVTTPRRETERENVTGRMASGRARGRGWLPTIIMIAFFVYFMIPLAWLIIASTKNNGDLFSTFGFWFSPTSTCSPTSTRSSPTPTASSSGGC